MKKEKHLVLSGSSTLYPYFVGAIRRLEQEPIKFKSISGTSGGILIGVLIASGMDSYKIERLILKKPLKSFIDKSWNFFDRFGILDGNILYEFLKKEIPYKTLGELPIPTTIVTTNLSKEYNTDRVTYFSSKNNPEKEIAMLLRTTISIPILFKYMLLDENIHVDGGICNNFPLNTIPENETQDIIGLKMDTSFAQQRKMTHKKGVNFFNFFNVMFEYLLTLLDTLMNSIEREHIHDSVYSKIIYIKSDISNTFNMFDYSESDIKHMINVGYNIVDKWLKENKL